MNRIKTSITDSKDNLINLLHQEEEKEGALHEGAAIGLRAGINALDRLETEAEIMGSHYLTDAISERYGPEALQLLDFYSTLSDGCKKMLFAQIATLADWGF